MRQRLSQLVRMRGSDDHRTMHGLEHRNVVRGVAEADTEGVRIALKDLANGLAFTAALEDMMEASAASPAKAPALQFGKEFRGSVLVENPEGLGVLALRGQTGDIERQAGGYGDLLAVHLVKAANGDAGRAARIGELFAQPGIAARCGAILGNVFAGYADLGAQPGNFGASLAGDENQRNPAVPELRQRRLRGLVGIGIVVEESPIEIREHHR